MSKDSRAECDCPDCREWRFRVAQMRDCADETAAAWNEARNNRQDDALAAVNVLIAEIGKNPQLRKSKAVVAAIRKFKAFESACVQFNMAVNQWSDLCEMLGDVPVPSAKPPGQNAPSTVKVQ